MPLSERIRIEIFIPDPRNQAHSDLFEELSTELSYSFGGYTDVSASGRYQSSSGQILTDRIKLIFSDAPLRWERDRLALEQYVDWPKRAAQQALGQEEVVLISVHPVSHGA